jgi:hypothetical protein
MIYVLASARPSYEFTTARAINDMGGIAIVPRRVDVVDGKPVYRPFLPNYMFLALTEAQWHQFHTGRLFHDKPQRNGDPIRTILPEFRKVLDLLPRTWGQFQAFADRAEMACLRRIDQWETGLKVAAYRRGDKLRIIGDMLDGQLSGRMAEFMALDTQGRIVVKVTGMEMMGKPVMATLKPGQIEGIAAE